MGVVFCTSEKQHTTSKMADTDQVAALVEQTEELRVEDVAEVKEASEEVGDAPAAEETESAPSGEESEDAVNASDESVEEFGDATESAADSTDKAPEESEDQSEEKPADVEPAE